MPYFSEPFYTNQFDQEMLDFIEENYDVGRTFRVGHLYLKYNPTTSNNYFWTSMYSFHKGIELLTKEQFKEKIGMTDQNTMPEEKEVLTYKFKSEQSKRQYLYHRCNGHGEMMNHIEDVFYRHSDDGVHIKGYLDEDGNFLSYFDSYGDVVHGPCRSFCIIDKSKGDYQFFTRVDDNIAAAEYDLSQIQKDCTDLDIEVSFSKEGVRITDSFSEMYAVDSPEEYDKVVEAIRLLNSKIV